MLPSARPSSRPKSQPAQLPVASVVARRERRALQTTLPALSADDPASPIIACVR